MSLFWPAAAGGVLLMAAIPAAAQHHDPQTTMELRRASAAARDYCLQRTEKKRAEAESAGEVHANRKGYSQRLENSDAAALEAEAASLDRRILLARARGEDPRDMAPNRLGDLLARYQAVLTRLGDRRGRAIRGVPPGDYSGQRDVAKIEDEGASRRYEAALLDCLEFKDRFPSRDWVDSRADADGAEFGAAPSDETPVASNPTWTPLPDAGTQLPEQKGVEYRVWMTGTFDIGGGVMTLNPAGGRYEYQNGRMSTTRIEGNVMEGRWEQDRSGGQCPDGGYWGKYRLTFNSGGFSGVFGYCDEEPHRSGGFQGTRRGVR